jgi:hypothetical protein
MPTVSRSIPVASRALSVAAALLLAASPLAAQGAPTAALADSARVSIESAVDRSDLTALEASIALLDRGLAMRPSDGLLRHYRGYALYRAGTMVMGLHGAARARPYFDRAAEALEPLAKGATIPETYAVLSSV